MVPFFYCHASHAVTVSPAYATTRLTRVYPKTGKPPATRTASRSSGIRHDNGRISLHRRRLPRQARYITGCLELRPLAGWALGSGKRPLQGYM